jgi:multiple sugar transport system ATP-binding protein
VRAADPQSGAAHGSDSRVVARLEAASRVRQGHEAELWFNSERLHLFDPESGRSLLAASA